MILLSLIFVLVSAITLLIGGLFRTEDLLFIYISIASALIAGIFLLAVVLRGSRRPKRPRAAVTRGSREEAEPATWAPSGWGGTAPEGSTALTREEEPATEPDAPSTPVAAQYEEGSDAASTDATAQLPDVAPAPTPPPKAPAPPAPPPAPARPASRGGSGAPAKPASPWAPPPPPPAAPPTSSASPSVPGPGPSNAPPPPPPPPR